MSTSKIFHCIVDDTALITNISEIEQWVLRSAIALVIPLHTLERLHVLKKDSSQIGQNARKAVKFLDEATSNPDVTVLIQEPDDQYQTWAQVEAHYAEAKRTSFEQKENVDIADASTDPQVVNDKGNAKGRNRKSDPNGQLAHLVLNKLNISKATNASPMSTPPLSPSSSGPQSSKTSPDVKSATMISNDLSPVPPTLKALINSIVWYTYEKIPAFKNVIFLTNSSDTAYLARDFGVASKNIHQLRAAIGVEEQEAKNHDKYQKKHGGSSSKPTSEPKTLFRYEEEESDEEEEVIFKPRGRGSSNKAAPVPRGSGNTGSVRSRGHGHGHSPANSLTGPPQTPLSKPQIPTEEIDPDSFDRGSFARGNTPLVSVGNHSANGFGGSPRGQGHRGNHSSGGTSRNGHHRGSSRGLDRGAGRARGRLFVP